MPKTVRVNLDTFRSMMKVKHEQEVIKLDVVNMTDVLDVIMWRYNEMVDALDEEERERIMGVKFAFTDVADQIATPLSSSDRDEDDEGDDDDDDEVEIPAPKRKKANRKKTTKRRSG